ncbi:MAG: O-antigen ligase family protein [Bacteroidia bacterium]|nr:O-antigen ligase family protein [Bacteroidia bacterium]
MEQFLKKYPFLTPVNLAWFGLLVALVGLTWSNALLSVGSVIVILAGFLAGNPLKTSRIFFKNKPALLLSLIFLIHLLAYFWTQNSEAWLKDISIKLPLPFMLFSLTVLPAFSRRQIQLLLLWLLALTAVTGGLTMINYLLHFNEINEMVVESREIRIISGRNHLYFSIIGALSVWAGIWLWLNRAADQSKWISRVVLVLTLLVFVQVHVLAARTGLLAMYASFGVVGSIWLASRKKWALLLGMAGVLLIIPITGYLYVPSLHNRVENTFEDLDRYLYDDYINYYSVSMRLEALETAFDLFENEPFHGVGLADLHERMREQYVENDSSLFPENRVLPHNQFVEYLAGLGLLGFLVFVVGFFSPLFDSQYRKSLLFISFWVIFLFAMQAESLLERQVGVFLVGLYWGAFGKTGAIQGEKEQNI